MLDQFGQNPIDVMKSIKSAMDPNGILNPGKIL
jgi:FAD/FMN-containing dehydrogenase